MIDRGLTCASLRGKAKIDKLLYRLIAAVRAENPTSGVYENVTLGCYWVDTRRINLSSCAHSVLAS